MSIRAHISYSTQLFYPYFSAIEQWKAFELSRQTIATLTAKLNAHEEKLNQRTATTETAVYRAQQVTAPTTNNNGDDKKKKKNGDWKKKVNYFGYGKKGNIAHDYNRNKKRIVVKMTAGRKKRRSARMWTRVSRRTAD